MESTLTSVKRLLNRIQVEPDSGCWIWQRAPNNSGYATTNWQGRSAFVHRIFYESFFGPIPEGLECDHLCGKRICVNPFHLEAVTHKLNRQRGRTTKYKLANTHCPHGHPYSGDNLYIDMKRGRIYRACRACRNQRKRLKRLERRVS